MQQYNTKVRSVPTNFTAMIFGYKAKPNFTVANEAQISVPPPVSFDKPASRRADRKALRCALLLAAAALLAAFVFGPALAEDVVPVPVLTGRVIDQTATLTPAQADALNAKLAAIETRSAARRS